MISITPARRLDWQDCSNLPLMGKAPGLIVDSNVTTCLPSLHWLRDVRHIYSRKPERKVQQADKVRCLN